MGSRVGLDGRKISSPPEFFNLFYSCKTWVQEHIVSVHITTVRMNTGTTMSMGTKICAGIVPELRWNATAPSGCQLCQNKLGDGLGQARNL